jgi:hypothetical protein
MSFGSTTAVHRGARAKYLTEARRQFKTARKHAMNGDCRRALMAIGGATFQLGLALAHEESMGKRHNKKRWVRLTNPGVIALRALRSYAGKCAISDK